jgi:hypothetical protein
MNKRMEDCHRGPTVVGLCEHMLGRLAIQQAGPPAAMALAYRDHDP